MSNLRPLETVRSVAEICIEDLIVEVPLLAAIAFDLDKTLVGQHETEIPDQHIEALIMMSGLGLHLGLISNAASQQRTERVLGFAETITSLTGRKTVAVTSRMVGGKKKPLTPVFNQFSAETGIDKHRIIYVGDQLFKDVLGANRAGYAGGILVAPYGQGDDPRVKYLQRPLEALVRPLVGAPLSTKHF